VANTILRRLTTDWGRSRRHAANTRSRIESAARSIHFGCSLELPRVSVRARDIENLAPGSVLRLNLAANVPPLWRVGGETLAQGVAVRQGPHRAARIETMVPDPVSGSPVEMNS
jgi:flagellar motor switch protein FliM